MVIDATDSIITRLTEYDLVLIILVFKFHVLSDKTRCPTFQVGDPIYTLPQYSALIGL